MGKKSSPGNVCAHVEQPLFRQRTPLPLRHPSLSITRENELTIRGKGPRQQICGQLDVGACARACRRVPNKNRTILATAKQGSVIWPQGQAPDFQLVTKKRSQRPPSVRSQSVLGPQTNRLVTACRGERFSIRPEHEGKNHTAMAFQSAEIIAR